MEHLQKYKEFLQSIKFNTTLSLLGNLSVLNGYSGLIGGNVFLEIVSEYAKLTKRFQKFEERFATEYMNLLKLLGDSIAQKELSPNMSAPPFDFDATNFRAQLTGEYYTSLRAFQSITTQIQKQIHVFKKDLQTNKKAQDIQQLEEEIAQLKKKEARLEQDGDCEKYRKTKDDIVGLKKELAATKTKMEVSQKKYVDTYFEKTNEIFRKLGSTDFELKKEINNLVLCHN